MAWLSVLAQDGGYSADFSSIGTSLIISSTILSIAGISSAWILRQMRDK
jgi:hypothetical protein